ncbi:hypothetical protein DAPPUDRAFT_255515 [Daphnia pulex]|uniref:Uncharacterized protein n=1 Tax=Daphnia pulex TaxID=6669 RepID=E9H9C8_DAPPU|nr:hypothetical protein DAPPUDRAFT_255515 [Daphnia pulex]|eukprot:EFX71679.1 hypothetical protein DAPPUDRAFT_255515 [Daphnia pulex]
MLDWVEKMNRREESIPGHSSNRKNSLVAVLDAVPVYTFRIEYSYDELSMKEENILYAELKTEFKQQEEIWNILSQITVQEEESELNIHMG